VRCVCRNLHCRIIWQKGLLNQVLVSFWLFAKKDSVKCPLVTLDSVKCPLPHYHLRFQLRSARNVILGSDTELISSDVARLNMLMPVILSKMPSLCCSFRMQIVLQILFHEWWKARIGAHMKYFQESVVTIIQTVLLVVWDNFVVVPVICNRKNKPGLTVVRILANLHGD
jgi:hypothetical protein